MKRKIRTLLGVSMLCLMIGTNIKIASSFYGIKDVRLPDFFYQQASFDKVRKFKERHQKCKVRIVTHTVVESLNSDCNIYHVEKIVADERW